MSFILTRRLFLARRVVQEHIVSQRDDASDKTSVFQHNDSVTLGDFVQTPCRQAFYNAKNVTYAVYPCTDQTTRPFPEVPGLQSAGSVGTGKEMLIR